MAKDSGAFESMATANAQKNPLGYGFNIIDKTAFSLHRVFFSADGFTICLEMVELLILK